MQKRMQKIVCRIAVLVIACILQLQSKAQADTIKISLNELEKRFLDSNLTLMAAHYNIDANKALVQQARLWDNPMLVTDQNIYADGKFFQHGKVNGQPMGQVYIQVQQLIKTAGKRNKFIAIASTNVKISELQLQQLLRDLRYQLRTDYYTLVSQLQSLKNNQLQLEQLSRLENAMQQQLTAGNIAKKDFVRIQALTISLQQDIVSLQQDISNTQADIRMLLHIDADAYILPTDVMTTDITSVSPVADLVQTAKQNNANYLLQQSLVIYQQQNLSYQKSLKVPDITVGPEYDQNSNYAPHYVGLTVSLPLPILNKNQGNIKAAEFAVKQQQVTVTATESELWNRINNAYHKLQVVAGLNSNYQKQFYSDYRQLYESMLESYKKRQVNLLEFLDFFTTYQDTQAKLLQQQLNIQLAKEELNYNIGIDVIK